MVRDIVIQYFVIIMCNNVARISAARQEIFTIDTQGCKIPAYPLVTSNIRPLMTPPSAAEVNCSSRTLALVKANSTHIWVVPGLEEFYQIFAPSEFYCCYRNFSARGNTENIGYGVCQDFTKAIKGKHEFVRVECYNSGEKIYEDLFRFNVYKKEKKLKVEDKKFNVLMLGIDNISRKNFLRTMPKTARFLQSRGSIQFRGFNKIGDNSFPNLFPMLAGKSYIQGQSCFKYNLYNKKECPFIWDVFKKVGYQTALASDSAIGVLGVYESLLPYKPTDFYMQSFMFETRHVFNDRTYDYHICLRDRYMYRELLKFVEDVVDTVRRGFFGYFWEESVSHHEVNYPHILDADYANLLRDIEKKKILEDTIVMIFSDHGSRYGKIVNVEEGRQESRLPLFEVLFPMRFRRRYKLAYKNLEINSRRLVTPYDVHLTLKDIANISVLDDSNLKTRIKANKSGNALSLFLPVPINRTCKSVGIPEHWCTCLGGEIITIGAKGQIFTAKYLLRHINQILSEYPQCHKLNIENIMEVTAIKDDTANQRTYRVLLQTKPGGGVFEGTLLQDHKMWMVSGSVSRLNSYKDQSHCVKDPYAKLFCYCRRPK